VIPGLLSAPSHVSKILHERDTRDCYMSLPAAVNCSGV